MAKVYITIGYAETLESRPGIWEEVITEHDYYGDMIKSFIKYTSSDKVNDDVGIYNDISIIADTYAFKKMHLMKYAKIGEIKWKISNVEIAYPRLKITLGGVYND